MRCPFNRQNCMEDCAFRDGEECLATEFLKTQVASMRLADKMMLDSIMPLMRRLRKEIGELPEEVKNELSDNLRQEIEDIANKLDFPFGKE